MCSLILKSPKLRAAVPEILREPGIHEQFNAELAFGWIFKVNPDTFVGVSSVTGEGMKGFFETVEASQDEYE